MLLANDPPSMLAPKAKPRDNDSIFYYHFNSVNVPIHLLMVIKVLFYYECDRYRYELNI